jgi:hypothetical protein
LTFWSFGGGVDLEVRGADVEVAVFVVPDPVPLLEVPVCEPLADPVPVPDPVPVAVPLPPVPLGPTTVIPPVLLPDALVDPVLAGEVPVCVTTVVTVFGD